MLLTRIWRSESRTGRIPKSLKRAQYGGENTQSRRSVWPWKPHFKQRFFERDFRIMFCEWRRLLQKRFLRDTPHRFGLKYAVPIHISALYTSTCCPTNLPSPDLHGYSGLFPIFLGFYPRNYRTRPLTSNLMVKLLSPFAGTLYR